MFSNVVDTKKGVNHPLLIAFFGYRQVTCRETSKNSSRPIRT